jgi:hypothetical protein
MIRATSLAALLGMIALGGCAPNETEPAPQAQPEAPAAAAPAPAAAQQPASPRDTARATVGGAQVMVDYGRPYMRGRTIMGGLVPYGTVWRTGANQATHLVTEATVRIGDVTVPAGTYTLYTVPGESEWHLIVNRQTGQWGTQYDQGQDVARIPMRVSRTAAPVEQFTVRIEGRGEREATLAMEWENTRAEVPFSVVGS